MKKTEAMRLCCRAFATHMDNGSQNVWLVQDGAGNPLSEADEATMRAAFRKLVLELRRRGGLDKATESAAKVYVDRK